LFFTQTARLADVVLPVQSWTEREGSYTSGERRVQRFYPAVPATTALPPRAVSPGVNQAPLLKATHPLLEGPLADFVIPALIGGRLNLSEPLELASAAAVFDRLAASVPAFAGLTYQKLAEVHEQWPIVGDLFYGGTSCKNTQGMGMQLQPANETGSPPLSWPSHIETRLPRLGLMAFPFTRLYDRGQTLWCSHLLDARIGEPYLVLNAQDAERLRIRQGAKVQMTLLTPGEEETAGSTPQGYSMLITARLDESLPQRVVLLPRSFGIPISEPVLVEIRRVE